MYAFVWCSQSAPVWLMHVSLLLAIISGAGVATLARLKWDPSTYLVFQGLLPTEYRVLGGVLCFGTFLLIFLAHLAVIAQTIRKKNRQIIRRSILFTYSALMVSLILIEICTVVWLCVRVYNWLQTNEATQVLMLVSGLKDFIYQIQKLLGWASNYFEVLKGLYNAMQEIKNDIPYNIYVGIFLSVLTGILQPLAVLLAWNSAFTYSNIKDKNITRTDRHIIFAKFLPTGNGMKETVFKVKKYLPKAMNK